MVTLTRRALAAAFFEQKEPRGWIPSRRALGSPVTHVVEPAAFSHPGVRLLKSRAWPGLQAKQEDGSFTAGPSGSPWITSNAWAIALERFRAPEAAVWVETVLPRGRALSLADYLVTLADCESAGGRWVIDCPSSQWLEVSNAVRFFAAHREWDGFASPGVVGVVPHEETEEVMVLLSRQSVPYRVVSGASSDLAALVVGAVDDASLAFARAGGLCVALTGRFGEAGLDPRWAVRGEGKGRVAGWKGEVVDPLQVVRDVRDFLGRGRDVVRAYNIHASSVRYTVSADGRRGVVQILNFTGKPMAEETTIWVGRKWRSARQVEFGGAGAKVGVEMVEGGTELSIPRRGLFSAIELEL